MPNTSIHILEENLFYYEDLQRACILINAAYAKYLKITQSKILKELESKFEIKNHVDSAKRDITSRVEFEFKSFLENANSPNFDWKSKENLKLLQSFLENFVYLSAKDLGNKH